MNEQGDRPRPSRREILKLAACWSVLVPHGFGSSAAADDRRPVRIVVGFAPGSGSDILARVVAPRLGAQLGRTVIVENRPGAAGRLGIEQVARAVPDGDTLTLGTTSTLITAPALAAGEYRGVAASLEPVSSLARAAFVIVTASAPSAPRSLGQLVDELERAPQAFASTGEGTLTHLVSELFLRAVRQSATHVPYQGSAQALADVAAGRELFAADTVAAALGPVRAGRLRPLAVTSAARVKSMPDVPTCVETGLPSLQVYAWWGLLAPPSTPAPAVSRLAAGIAEVMRGAEIAERLDALDLEPFVLPGEEFARLIRRETPMWHELARSTGARRN